jgi:hypothetical protein
MKYDYACVLSLVFSTSQSSGKLSDCRPKTENLLKTRHCSPVASPGYQRKVSPAQRCHSQDTGDVPEDRPLIDRVSPQQDTDGILSAEDKVPRCPEGTAGVHSSDA